MVRVLSLMLSVLLLVQPSAFAGDFLIAEHQLVRLEKNLIQLKAFNSKLQEQVNELNRQQKIAEQSLTTALASYEKYAKTQHRKINSLKFQRNCLLVGVCGLLLIKK